MKVLVTGAAGSVGRHLVGSLLKRGWQVRALDSNGAGLDDVKAAAGYVDNLETITAAVEDREAMREAVDGVDAVCHLAWSFSDDPEVLMNVDLKGSLNILELLRNNPTCHLIYASSAVVYGRPVWTPITEDHPLNAEMSRKPFYAAAKVFAEKLNLAYWVQYGVPVTNVRFWWAYGDEIGGRHLRDMARAAVSGETLTVVGGAGGSFVHLDDLAEFVILAMRDARAYGRTFNLASAFVEWKEVAQAVLEAAGACTTVRVLPEEEWTGPLFLLGKWELSTALAEEVLGYRPRGGPEWERSTLREAVSSLVRKVQRGGAG